MTVFGRFLPKGHVMPANLYQSDKILRALKMPYDKIHACEKGCVFFSLNGHYLVVLTFECRNANETLEMIFGAA